MIANFFVPGSCVFVELLLRRTLRGSVVSGTKNNKYKNAPPCGVNCATGDAMKNFCPVHNKK